MSIASPALACCLLCAALSAAPNDPRAADDANAVSRLVNELASQDSSVRWHAAYSLGQSGAKAAAAVNPLIKILENRGEDEYVRGMACWALGRIGASPDRVVPLLLLMLESKHVSVRRNSARALGEFGPEAKSSLPGLAKLLEDEDPPTRIYAATSLWKIAQHPRAVPFLIAAVRSGGPGSFESAAALGEIATDSEEALSALIESLGHQDEDVRRAAGRSLAGVGYKAVPPLIDALKGEAPRVRRSAARALGLSTSGKAAEAALLQAVNDSDSEVRETAAWALGRVRSGSRPATK